jgi:hypothetical protein
LDINTVDDDEVKNKEEFFHLMSGAINRLGQWCLEIYGKADLILVQPQLIQQYEDIMNRVLAKGINLFDTNNPKIALHLLELFK